MEHKRPAGSPLPERLRRVLSNLGKIRPLAAGEALFRRGDAAIAVFEVESGSVRMVRDTVDGHQAVLHSAGSGQWLAEAALFSKTYHCDAIATQASQVRSFPKREFLKALRSDSGLSLDFMFYLAQQVQDLRTRLEQRNIRSAQERVLQYLIAAADESGWVRLNGTLMDLSGELGLSHESLYRTLATLERRRIISRKPGAIFLLRQGGL